jgi:hypothetical protein
VLSAKATTQLQLLSANAYFSAEIWACIEGGHGVPRVAFSSGRFRIGVNNLGFWTMAVNVLNANHPLICKATLFIVQLAHFWACKLFCGSCWWVFLAIKTFDAN